MSKWFPLHNHSHFSLLDGLSKPEKTAERLIECGHAGSALTDHGSISGCPGFMKTLASVCRGCSKPKNSCRCKGNYSAAKLKAILGSEFYVCRQDATVKDKTNGNAHLCVLAKGLQGWKNLMKASSASYMPNVFYRKPRLDIERLGQIGQGQFIAFSGHMGSDLADVCFKEPKLAYDAGSYEEARKLVRDDWKDAVFAEIHRYQKAFGKENFYVEIQLIDQENLPASLVVARILRWAAKQLGVPKIATADSHYPRRDDATDQRVLLCSAMDTTMQAVKRQLEANEEVGLGGFFKSRNYHIPTEQEMCELHGDNPDELANTLEIASRCEMYSVGDKPMLPQFKCPRGLTPDQYLMELCMKGWNEKIVPKVKASKLPTYHARLHDKEFPVITGAGLSGYFLIVQDYIRYATEKLVKTGKGRGSGAGCLISYLTGITRVDPILFDLLFERFYNAGRNSPGRVAFPDIDSDFPIAVREDVIQYLRDTYGEDKVCQMATFSRMQGRGAIKDVLRAYERCGYEEMNKITENIPDESEIADELQEMSEAGEDPSIIMWALHNNPEPLKQWAWLKEKKDPEAPWELDGPLSLEFAQAIRLEGTKRNMGKHPSGIIITSEPLADIVPMCWDKSSEQMMVSVDMRDAEDMGLVKFDILGLRTLDCIMGAERIIRHGRLR